MGEVALYWMDSYIESLYRINAKISLWGSLAERSFFDILNIENPEKRISIMSSFLYWLLHNWASIEEMKWIIDAIIRFEWFDFTKNKIRIKSNSPIVSILWSGKKGLKTFNISTWAALVAAASWWTIVKVGSSSTSSLAWSRDILKFLWAEVDIDINKMIKIVENINFWFFSIEWIIPKFDSVYGWRFYAPHILSYILPALISPVYIDGLVYWLSLKDIENSSDLLKYYWFNSFSVVSTCKDNIHFIDEIAWFSYTNIIRYKNGIEFNWVIDPLLELNLPSLSYEDVKQWLDLQDNLKKLIVSISNSWDVNKNNIIAINASELLYVSWLVEDMREWYEKSLNSIKKNKVIDLLVEFVEMTWGKMQFNFL